MSITRLNPMNSITSGTPTKAQSDVTTGYIWWRKIGRLVIAEANFMDATPVNGEAILSGYPAPEVRVPLSVVCGTDARRVYLSTDGKLIWDGAVSANWSNLNFSYIAAS